MIRKFLTYKNVIFAILAIIFIVLIPKVANIILLFFASYVFACALNPYVNSLSKKINRNLAIISVLTGCFVVIQLLFVPIFIVGFKEIERVIATLPDKISMLFNFLSTTSLYGHKFSDLIDLNSIDVSSLFGNSPDVAQNVINQSMTITAGIVQFAVVLIAMTMIIFYILYDKEYLKKKYLELIPPDLKGKAMTILEAISNKVGGYVRAQVLSMVAIGVMVSIVLIILKVPYSALLGLISGIFDIVPIVGPTLALALIVISALQLGWIKIGIIILMFILIQQLSNYLIRPLLFGKLMSLHPLTIFLALFLAQQFLGFWGVILSPAIAATICVLIDELYIIPMNKTVPARSNS